MKCSFFWVDLLTFFFTADLVSRNSCPDVNRTLKYRLFVLYAETFLPHSFQVFERLSPASFVRFYRVSSHRRTKCLGRIKPEQGRARKVRPSARKSLAVDEPVEIPTKGAVFSAQQYPGAFKLTEDTRKAAAGRDNPDALARREEWLKR